MRSFDDPVNGVKGAMNGRYSRLTRAASHIRNLINIQRTFKVTFYQTGRL